MLVVRSSCAAALSRTSLVTLNDSAVRAFVDEKLPALLDTPKLVQEGIDFPLLLDSPEELVDLVVFYTALQFGSGFRRELHALVSSGASDSMVRGVLSFYLSGKRPSAGVLCHIREADVARIFELPLDEDVPAAPHLPGVTISRPGPLHPLISLIARALQSCGQALSSAGCRTFCELLTQQRARFCDEGGTPNACLFACFLAETFPAFRDEGEFEGLRVSVLKKAQLCAKELARKAPGAGSPFAFSQESLAALTCFADNVLPCVLRAHGILVVEDALAARIEEGQDLSSGKEDLLLRAAAVVACERIVQLARSGAFKDLTEALLDNIFWKVGKEKEFRSLARHVNRATYFY
jgi:Potential Queuosine, Q, salvage protein family